MKPTFFGRFALGIICAVCFLVPFALRGARVSVQGMRNEVSDWLPTTFKETAEMKWFWKHFLGERFVVVSWQGCTGKPDDEVYKLFIEKLHAERPPSRQRENALDEQGPPQGGTESTRVSVAATEGTSEGATQEAVATQRRGLYGLNLDRGYDFIGDRLGLFSTGNYHTNFGNRSEKWLLGSDKQWYFITPTGELYLWQSSDTPLATLLGRVWRHFFGGQIEGKYVASLGEEDGPWYYENPRRLNAQLFKTATTGPEVLADLIHEETGILRDDLEEARRRLTGVLFGPEEQTCIILTLTQAGRSDFHRVIGRGMLGKPRGRVYDLAQECGLSMEQVRLGGPPVDNVAIDEEGTITLVRLVSLSAILGIGLAFTFFRSITATIIVFFVGGIGAVMSLAMVGWMNSTLDAVLMSMPALVYVLGISGAVHLINYYREHLETHGPVGAPEAAISHGWKPAVLCNITTAIGLFSLCTSEIIPIRKFGIFSGIGVLATVGLLFAYLPAALEIWRQKPRSAERRRKDEQPWYEKYIVGAAEQFGAFVIRWPNLVAIVCVVIITGTGWGVTRINTSVNLLKMFDADAKILKDYAWLEENLGKLVPMEVVVKVAPRMLMPAASDADPSSEATPGAAPQRYQLSFLDRMLIAERIQRVVDKTFGANGQGIAGQSLSAATFALPSRDRYSSMYGRMAVNSALLKHRDELLSSDYVRLDTEDNSELWRISLRIGASQDIDYGTFVNELKSAIEPIIAAYRQRELILRDIGEKTGGKAQRVRVLLLGAPLVATKKEASKSDDAPSDEATVSGSHQINQTEIFATTLRDILRSASVEVRWHNPATDPAPHDWQASLAGFDSVVLVQETSDYPLETIRTNSAKFVDARQHVYHLSDETMNEHSAHSAGTAVPDHPGVTAIYTGVVPIVYKAQRTLLNSLIESTFWSFITITPLMMFVSRGIRAGAVVMLPNVLPVLVVFGAMGWLDIQVDIGSMMSASIALGVAVDDTIHFLTWYRTALDRLGDRNRALLAAYSHCATPTFQAAMISGLGLSIFAFSTFTPTQRFGYLMLSILVAGMVAELVFMPALLAGPLGRVFKPRPRAGGVPGDEHGLLDAEVAAIVYPEMADQTAGSGAESGNGRAETGNGHSKPHHLRADGAHHKARQA